MDTQDDTDCVDKHTLFFETYHCLRVYFPDLKLRPYDADEMDSLIWRALGYTDQFTLNKTNFLTDFDISRLKLLCGPHAYCLFKAMLAKVDSDE